MLLDKGADQKMDYIYIDDCVEAIGRIVNNRTLRYDAYNIGGGQLVPYSRVIDKVKALYPKSGLQWELVVLVMMIWGQCQFSA